jgi:hypothetical protein
MRHRAACRLAPREPGREHRALAHPRPAGHHDPAVDGAREEQLVEPGQQTIAPHEPRVSLPLEREADRLR